MTTKTLRSRSVAAVTALAVAGALLAGGSAAQAKQYAGKTA